MAELQPMPFRRTLQPFLTFQCLWLLLNNKKTDPFFKIFTIFTPYTAKGNSRNITRRKGFITNGNGYDSR